MWYTGIGSRKTPFEIQQLQSRLAAMFFEKGWILRSGGAGGSDEAYQFGVMGARELDDTHGMEIYLPWHKFNGLKQNGNTGFFDVRWFDNFSQAQQIAQSLHPGWDKLSDNVRLLHTRNVYQVLGITLEHPSKFLTCWAPPKGECGEVEGGTNTAVKLALRYKVPIFNLYDEAVKARAERALEEHKKGRA